MFTVDPIYENTTAVIIGDQAVAPYYRERGYMVDLAGAQFETLTPTGSKYPEVGSVLTVTDDSDLMNVKLSYRTSTGRLMRTSEYRHILLNCTDDYRRIR